MPHRLLILLVLFAAPAAAELPTLRPNTGIYIESDYAAPRADCDWYYPASMFLAAEPPERETPCPVVVRVRGALTPAGVRRFIEVSDALAKWPAVPMRVVLNSSGGDADSAFWFARTIRQHPVYRLREPGVMTAIDEAADAVCYSSCVIVFAAGFERQSARGASSRLGIHRPGQLDRRDLTFDSSQENAAIRRLRLELMNYFLSVDVDPELVDAMYAVPFDELRVLTADEARRYRLFR